MAHPPRRVVLKATTPGAKAFIAEGALDDVDAVIGYHVRAGAPEGLITYTPGPAKPSHGATFTSAPVENGLGGLGGLLDDAFKKADADTIEINGEAAKDDEAPTPEA